MADPNYDLVSLLLRFGGPDGSTVVVDESKYGHPVTVHGGARIDANSSPFGAGGSLRLAGLGDYLSIPFHESFVMEDLDFTVEGFSILDTLPDSATLVYFYEALTNNRSWRTAFEPENSILRGGVSTNGTSPINVSAAWTPATGEWMHWALVRRGNELACYLRGIKGSGTATLSGALFTPAGIDLTIGMVTSDPTHPNQFVGRMAQIRVTKGLARYTGNFTPPSAPFEGAPQPPVQTPSGSGGIAVRAPVRSPVSGLVRPALR